MTIAIAIKINTLKKILRLNFKIFVSKSEGGNPNLRCSLSCLEPEYSELRLMRMAIP